jgi:hypothetical protein
MFRAVPSVVLLVLGRQHLRWQVSVVAGTGDARGFDDLREGLILMVATVWGTGEFRRIHHTGPNDPFALTCSHSAGVGVGCALDRTGSLHLAKDREHHHRQRRHVALWMTVSTPWTGSARFRTPTPRSTRSWIRATVSRTVVSQQRARAWTMITSPPRDWFKAW